MLTQLTFDDALAARDRAMARVEAKAESYRPSFADDAARFVLAYLRKYGPTSSETLTEACELAGIRAHDARAMGPVIMRLARAGAIVKAGHCQRKRGHGTSGGIIWSIAIDRS